MVGLQKILLVEDTPEIIDIYSRVLIQQGYELKVVSTVDELLDVVADYKPDLIFLDIMLPGGRSGLDALKILRSEDKYSATKSKIVLLTNLGHSEEVEKLWVQYADGYVIKAEIDPHELKDIIESFNTTEEAEYNTESDADSESSSHGQGMPGNYPQA